MYVCVYIYIYISIHIHTFIHLNVCNHMYIDWFLLVMFLICILCCCRVYLVLVVWLIMIYRGRSSTCVGTHRARPSGVMAACLYNNAICYATP